MADGVNIDWSLAKPQQDLASAYANAFQLGRKVAGQQIQGNAMQASLANPTAPVDPRLGSVNPEPAVQLQGRQQDAQDQGRRVQQATAEYTGDLQGAMNAAALRGVTDDAATLKAQLDALPEQQRQIAITKAQQVNEALAHVLQGLQQSPPEQRLPIAQHVAQTSGLMDPSRITVDDVTDAGIQRHLASAIMLNQLLKEQQQGIAHGDTHRRNLSD